MDNRVHKIHTDKGVYDAYKHYKNNVIQQGKYKLTRTEFSTLLKRYYTLMLTEVINNNYEFKLGRVGQIKIVKYEVKPKFNKEGNLVYNKINWKKTKELGKHVLEFNDHTGGFVCRFNWIKKNAVINKQLFRFKISRDIARLLAKELKTNKNLNFSTYGRR